MPGDLLLSFFFRACSSSEVERGSSHDCWSEAESCGIEISKKVRVRINYVCGVEFFYRKHVFQLKCHELK